jgi:hypothetical protein
MDVNMNKVIGADPHRRVSVDESNLEFDSSGRIRTMQFYYEDNGQVIGRYEVSYKDNYMLVNGYQIAIYSYLGGGSSNTVKESGEVTSTEVARTAARAATQLVGNRVASILAPRPKPSTKTAAMNYNLNDAQILLAEKNTQRLEQGFAAAPSGVAAGDQPTRWGVWSNATVNKLDNYKSDAKYSGGLLTVMLGADYKITDKLLVGLALGFERTYLKTDFNDGWLQASGLTISPYIGYSILDNLTWDLTGGVTFTSNYSTRANSTLEFHSSYESLRTMASTNFNYYYQIENWLLSAKAGFMYTNDYTGAFTERGLLGFRSRIAERNAYVGEFVAGGRVGYLFEKVEPYVAVNYLYDPWMTLGNELDRDEIEGVLGLNVTPWPSFLLGIELARSFARDDTDTMRCSVNLRYEF